MRISAILLVVFGRVDDGSGVTPTMEAARLVGRHEAELENISNRVNRDGGPEVPTVGIDLGDPKGYYIQKEAEEK